MGLVIEMVPDSYRMISELFDPTIYLYLEWLDLSHEKKLQNFMLRRLYPYIPSEWICLRRDDGSQRR